MRYIYIYFSTEIPDRANGRSYRMKISDRDGYGGTGADGDGDTGDEARSTFSNEEKDDVGGG